MDIAWWHITYLILGTEFSTVRKIKRNKKLDELKKILFKKYLVVSYPLLYV